MARLAELCALLLAINATMRNSIAPVDAGFRPNREKRPVLSNMGETSPAYQVMTKRQNIHDTLPEKTLRASPFANSGAVDEEEERAGASTQESPFATMPFQYNDQESPFATMPFQYYDQIIHGPSVAAEPSQDGPSMHSVFRSKSPFSFTTEAETSPFGPANPMQSSPFILQNKNRNYNVPLGHTSIGSADKQDWDDDDDHHLMSLHNVERRERDVKAAVRSIIVDRNPLLMGGQAFIRDYNKRSAGFVMSLPSEATRYDKDHITRWSETIGPFFFSAKSALVSRSVFAYAGKRGRYDMEDRFSIHTFRMPSNGAEYSGDLATFYGVYDGHSGEAAAEYTAARLAQVVQALLVKKPLDSNEGCEPVLSRAYQRIEREELPSSSALSNVLADIAFDSPLVWISPLSQDFLTDMAFDSQLVLDRESLLASNIKRILMSRNQDVPLQKLTEVKLEKGASNSQLLMLSQLWREEALQQLIEDKSDKEAEEILSTTMRKRMKLSGTTATTALLIGNTAYISNAGDSVAIRFFRQRVGLAAHVLSVLDRATNEEEAARVRAAGGVVEPGSERVNAGVLFEGYGYSRSIGESLDSRATGIIPDPHFFAHSITPDDEFMLLATDGLTDGMTLELLEATVNEVFSQHGRKVSQQFFETLKEVLMERALGGDNLTVMMIDLTSH